MRDIKIKIIKTIGERKGVKNLFITVYDETTGEKLTLYYKEWLKVFRAIKQMKDPDILNMEIN